MVESMLSLCLADATPVGPVQLPLGPYFATWKIVTILVMLLPWLYLAPKVSKDALSLRLSQTVWAALTVGAGAGRAAVATAAGFLPGHGDLRGPGRRAAGGVPCLSQRPRPAGGAADHAKSGQLRQEKVVLVAPVNKVKLYDHDSRIIAPTPTWPAEDIEAYNHAQDFLYDMLCPRASEGDITPDGDHARVRLVIDGMITQIEEIELARSEAMIQFLKAPAGMNPEDRRRPQKGQISVDLAQAPRRSRWPPRARRAANASSSASARRSSRPAWPNWA